ncbi:olfactory receptor 6X1-like [Hemicordylus capensis]|uniref:olfactory receptor 6X1-like n=1 Tax=Hemicordylus capensis TaxID=884348 RepID=UPI00230361B4|nr:olfactory receptor 6X1-like [Hemicordylus capensis]
MLPKNQTTIHEFILQGFPGSPELQKYLFVPVLFMYVLTILGNVLIVFIIIYDHRLHNPMYFFLGNFSFLEIFYVTTLSPKMLANFLAEKRAICFSCCITQAFSHFLLGATEFFLLAAMSFDRYMAICNPLHYSIIMNHQLCLQMALGSWLGGFFTVIVQTVLLCQLPFCGPNLINHFYCDVTPLLSLACADTRLLELIILVGSALLLFSSFLFTAISYIFIISTILRIPSSSGRQKAFSTCAAHLTVVSIQYGTVMFMYVKPKANSSLEVNKVVSVLNTVITPLLNPFIYTLRNKDVKEAMRKATDIKKYIFQRGSYLK